MKIIGLALLVAGLGLAYWGYQVSESLGSQINETIMGAPTDKAMSFYIGGAAGFIVGLVLLLKK